MTRSGEEIEPAILRRGHERPRERLVETARQQILANQIIPISNETTSAIRSKRSGVASKSRQVVSPSAARSGSSTCESRRGRSRSHDEISLFSSPMATPAKEIDAGSASFSRKTA